MMSRFDTLKKNTTHIFKGEQKAMGELSKSNDIIISNADKGGAVVSEKYINEANRQLPDKHGYNMLQEGPTLQQSKLINDTINRFKK